MITYRRFTPSFQETKAWGYAEHGVMWDPIAKDNNDVSKIKVKQGGYCSSHKHRLNDNVFVMLEGILRICFYELDKKNSDHLILKEWQDLRPFDIITVEAGTIHSFFALEESRALELYFGAGTREDIVRFNEGGIDEIHKRSWDRQ